MSWGSASAQATSQQESAFELARSPPTSDKDTPIADNSVAVPSTSISEQPPDGGLSAWLTIAGAWLVQFCTFGYINAFGVYQDYYTNHFLSNKSPSDISWIGSFQLFMQYAPGIFVGAAFDEGYFHHIMIAGSAIYVFSMFMLSLTKPGQYYQVFLSQGVGMGIGQGMTFLPTLSIVSHHFKRRRALATGIVVTGASAGGIVFPILLNNLFASPAVGFANGVRASAGLVAGCMIIANCLMSTRLPPKSKRSSDIPGPDVKAILRDTAYMVSIAAAFLTNTGLAFPYFYLQLFATSHGVSSTLGFYSLAILNAGSACGRLLPTFLADKVGVYNALLPCILSFSVFVFGLFGTQGPIAILIVTFLIGFSSGAYVSLIPSLLAKLCRHMGELGTRVGIAFSVVGIAMLIGTPIAGAILTGSFLWGRAIAFSGTCIAAGAGLMTLSRFLFVRQRKPETQRV